MPDRFSFTAPLWQHRGGSWCFVTLPREISDAVRDIPRPPRPGFGSVRVVVAVGDSRWSTSLFPDSASRCYVLPIKKSVRLAESIDIGDDAVIVIELTGS